MYLQYLKTNYIVGPLSFLILQNIFKGADNKKIDVSQKELNILNLKCSYLQSNVKVYDM